MNKQEFINKKIVHMGEVWFVLNVGTQTEKNTFCHLANVSRGKQQKNGWNPIQINDWIDTSVLLAAK